MTRPLLLAKVEFVIVEPGVALYMTANGPLPENVEFVIVRGVRSLFIRAVVGEFERNVLPFMLIPADRFE